MYEAFKKLLCAVLIGLLLCPPASAGGIQVDAAAPAANQAGLTAAGNGVPMVNIVAPNSGGVSHNMFHDFNVGKQGVIINNSNAPGVSRLGGAIGDNPNLGGGPRASVILNEVTSTNRSLLEGYTEVFGGGHYILANPNGVTINGGGFIGTPKATMTTGVPTVNGGDIRLDVTRGDVLVEGAGINASNLGAFEIVSRTAKINADIQAQRLDIIAGKSSYDPRGGTVTQVAPDGSPLPAVVLDSTALGGMYAGRINLVGTEKGVGVNLEGITQATDQLTLTAEGRIEIKDKLASGNTLAVRSEQDAVTVSGTVFAANAADVSAKGKVEVANTLTTDGSLVLRSDQDSVTVSGTASAKSNADVSSRGKIDITGALASGDALTVRSKQDAVSISGTAFAKNSADVSAKGKVEVTNTLASDGDLTVRAEQDAVTISGTASAKNAANISAKGKIEVTNTLASDGGLAVRSEQDSVAVSGKVFAKGTAHLSAKDTVLVAKTAPTDAALVKAGTLKITGGKLDNRNLVAAGTSFDIAATDVANTGTIYSSGTGAFHVSGALRNDRGTILSQGDMLFEGAAAGQKMALLRNDSGLIESQGGGLTFRAVDFQNNNTGLQVVQGTTPVSYSEGGYWLFGNEWDETRDLFAYYTGRMPQGGWLNATSQVLYSEVIDILGLDPSRNVFTRQQVQAAITEIDKKIVENPGLLDAMQQRWLDQVKSSISDERVYYIKTVGFCSGTFYAETKTRDSVSGKEKGGKILAQDSILIDGGVVRNNVSAIASTTGDITITAATFENVGHEIYERNTIEWGRGIFRNEHGPRISPTGGGAEVVLTVIDHAYGAIDAGNKVNINVTHAANGIVERNGIFNPQPPVGQPPQVADVAGVSLAIPTGGLFVTNLDPTHPYQIETNPALTDLNKFLGSDYLLSKIGEDATEMTRKRLGDAYYENRLIREQIMSITGRRFLSGSMTGDAAQVQALMDNALAVRAGLDLTIGVGLTPEQIAALDRDIVWMVRQTVNGEDVLVPVVYLGKNSLKRIAQGGAVIAGKDVEIKAGGAAANTGAILADNSLSIDAGNIFNAQGELRGKTVLLAAAESISNTGGTIRGDAVTLKAGQDIISSAATATFQSRDTTATHVSQRGAITSGGALNMEAGRDIALLGTDVSSGGDAKLKAGRDVSVSTASTGSRSETSGRGYNTHAYVTANQGSTLASGGALSVEAGQDLAVHGSRVGSAGDMDLSAGRHVSITSAADSVDFYSHAKGKSGGMFGGKKEQTLSYQATSNVASTIQSGGTLNVEAGKTGIGDLVVSGSKAGATNDVTLAASGEMQILAAREERSSMSDEKKSGFMGLTSSMGTKENRSVTTVRSEVEAGGSVDLTAKKDVTVQASKLKAGDSVSITSEEGQVAMLTTKDSRYERSVSSKTGWITWNSKDKGQYAETVVNTLIEPGNGFKITARDGVTVEYKQTGNLRQDVQQLAQVPGMEWMGGLLQRDDVDWKAVQENYDSWNKKQSGLSPTATLVVSIVAAAVASGAASSLAWTVMGETATGASAMTLALHDALTVCFTTVAAQMATAGADTAAGGDFQNHLKGMVSESGVRSLLSSMVLAGILSTYGETFASYSPPMEVLATTTVKTLTGTIVGGEDLEKTFLTALGSSFGGYLNGKITAAELNQSVKVILAGAAGAAGAAIAGGDPMQGAMSAIVAELARSIATPELSKEQKKVAIDKAKLSKCSYDASCHSVGDYREATQAELEAVEIDPGKLTNNKSGYKAKVFINDASKEVVVAFAGTDSLLDVKDWQANFAQAFGLVGDQYTQAGDQSILYGLKALASGNGYELIATGHSLGGGMATMVASTDLFDQAIVFNPAGVHENTIETIKGNPDIARSRTIAYVSRGDILTNVQDLLGFLLPRTVGTRVLVGPGGLHGIDDMINAFTASAN